jgi:23S rRNA (pseudouridine1915-N3)-methyltransferase
VGKLRTPYWEAAQEEYARRLKRYASLTISETKDALGKGFSEDIAKEREGKSLLEKSAAARWRIALAPAGRGCTSEAFAQKLQQWFERHGHIAFLLGGPAGLPEGTLNACDESLSLSAMTFPHELARILFLEQLYRAFTILKGEKYHR